MGLYSSHCRLQRSVDGIKFLGFHGVAHSMSAQRVRYFSVILNIHVKNGVHLCKPIFL